MVLSEIPSFEVTLAVYRMLVAEKWNHVDKRKSVGRPPTPQEVVDLVLKFTRENLTWGYDRIANALANLGHDVSDQTVGNILKFHGIEPAPDRRRQMTWSTFLRAHWNQLAAVDFTTIEVWTTGGLTTFYLLFAMRLATRQVYFAGCTTNPTGPWMAQIARNLTDTVDGPFRELVQFVLTDRDTKFTAEFRAILKSSGVASVLLPPKSPNCNAHLERFFRSLKEEALERMIFFSERALAQRPTSLSLIFMPNETIRASITRSSSRARS